MPRFRQRDGEASPLRADRPLSEDEIRQVIAGVIQPAHFFVREPLHLEWQNGLPEESAWEIYQGRLLDPAHTRLRQSLECWNVFCVESGNRSAEPLLSLKLDMSRRQLYVTRAIYCYAWEGYHAGDNVYLSRETRKWIRELVGSIALEHFSCRDELRDEIICLLFQAVIGCSRLPLQSVEAPLPAFSLGRLAYIHRTAIGAEMQRAVPMQSFRDLIEQGLHDDLAWLEKAKLLEILLRSTPQEELGPAAVLLMSRWHALAYSDRAFVKLCRTLFNEVALSPYTDFVDKLLLFLKNLTNQGHLTAEGHSDLLSYMLRQNARHLTAYDLITFHHRGANYPDALLLDTVLKAYLALIEDQQELFVSCSQDDGCRQKRKRLRRRALRQAWVLRRTNEGLPVPDAPTSPGENARVLPPPFERVPDEQIFQPGKRAKRLFEGKPLLLLGNGSREVMREAIEDLHDLEELQELGMAVFLDRSFGMGKPPAEPDRTLLLSHETFSLSVAERRLQLLTMDPAFNVSREVWQNYKQKLLAQLSVKGIPITPGRREQKPGAVSLQDAARVAKDMIVLRTTRQAVQAFLEQFDFTALAKQFALDFLDKRLLIVTAASTRCGPEQSLDVYDERLRRRLELQVDLSQGYESRAGHEYPAAGLRVLRVWEADGDGELREHIFEQENIVVPGR
jgi:hypothetical protein